ncbi:hypothetical protein GEMRC1_002672 [Eukaryota sp. GEM-RC1]
MNCIFIFRATVPISDDVSVSADPLFQWYPESEEVTNLSAVSELASHMMSLVQDSYVMDLSRASSSTTDLPSNLLQFKFGNHQVAILPLCSSRSLYLAILFSVRIPRFNLVHNLSYIYDSVLFFLFPSSLPPVPEIPSEINHSEAKKLERLYLHYSDDLRRLLTDRFSSTSSLALSLVNSLTGKGWIGIDYAEFPSSPSTGVISSSMIVRSLASAVSNYFEKIERVSEGLSNLAVIGSILMSGSELASTTLDPHVSRLAGLAVSGKSYSDSFSLLKRITVDKTTYNIHKVSRPVQLSSKFLENLSNCGLYPCASDVFKNFKNLLIL